MIPQLLDIVVTSYFAGLFVGVLALIIRVRR